ncbi:MAG: RIP metalloprotease RseP [Deltaproteobacteria bacterium]|nr:RIP metalloprotease RseP [Deltaproteobacteria bacterium]
MMTIVYFIISLGLLVFIHEFGHFLVAKLSGIRVEKFSLGFGPKLISFRKGETEYLLSLLPLGGYVKLTGEDPDSPEASAADSYSQKSIAQRLRVVVAGPFMNLLLALFFMPLVFMIGKMEPIYLDQKPVVLGVLADSAAAKAGLQKGDEFLRVNGRGYSRWRDLLDYILLHPEEEVVVDIQRAGGTVQKKIVIESHPSNRSGFLGVEPGQFVGNDPVVDEVSPDSPAAEAGFRKGDRVLSINGKSVMTWTEMSQIVSASEGRPLAVVVGRSEGPKDLSLTPFQDQASRKWLMGVRKEASASSETMVLKKYPMGQAVVKGMEENWKLTKLTFGVLYRLVSLKLSYKALGGPIRIAQGAAMAAESGVAYFLYFIAFLSLQLAVLNILPIPVLDGGHVLYLFLEKVRRRPVSMRVRSIADQTGMGLLLLLMFFVTFNDIDAVWGLKSLFEKVRGIF